MAHGLIKTNIMVELNTNHPTNQSFVWVWVVMTNATSYDVLMVVLCCMLSYLYWTFGRRLFPTNLGGNQEMNIKLNSMFNILHKVLDQLVVVPCWLDLTTHYLGLGLLEGNLNVNHVPSPLENMTHEHPSHVALSTHDHHYCRNF